jgi:hypothetical protein
MTAKFRERVHENPAALPGKGQQPKERKSGEPKD